MSLGKFTIGIDIETITTHVSVVKDGRVVSVPSASGKVGFPTLAAFEDTKCLVGETALKYATKEDCTFKLYKKIPVKVDNDSKHPVPEDVDIKFMGKTQRFKVWEMVAAILAQAKKDAERFLGERIKGVVIIVPSHFNITQRRAMVKAAFIANLPVERLLNRTSALMIGNCLELDGYYVIIDFGNTWFQVTVMSREAGEIHVLKDDSIEIGGQSFIIRLMLYFSSLLANQCNFNVMSDKVEFTKLKSACEKAKIDLDFFNEAFVQYHTLEHFISFKIKRKKFEELCASEIKKIQNSFTITPYVLNFSLKLS
ncbi:hypothetical protein DSO57_1015060 [Entomophthora muscae]|uniref:Uncharacterized protein n=1 Tax=Entomophthora muscae TaxID=34485 RepID=A0ACC2SIN9_9FUNG|nr:hypothetical protein DSO57_1015060 [Entomophthora muscae]